MGTYRDLMVWQKSMELVIQVYQVTQAFPASESFGLTAQVRRCAVSVPSNIAEGHGRDSANDFHRFLAIAQGSLKELETQLLIAQRLHYLPDAQVETLLHATDEIGKMLTNLQKLLRHSPQKPPTTNQQLTTKN